MLSTVVVAISMRIAFASLPYPHTPFTGVAYKSDKKGVFAHSYIGPGDVIFQVGAGQKFSAEVCFNHDDSFMKVVNAEKRAEFLAAFPLYFNDQEMNFNMLDVLCLSELLYDPFESEEYGEWATMLSKKIEVPLVWEKKMSWGWLASQRAQVLQSIQKVLAVPGFERLAPFLNEKKLKKAWSIMFDRATPTAGLIPGIDFINHRTDDNANVYILDEPDGHKVVAMVPIEPGTEITMHYMHAHGKPAGMFFFRHGFVDPTVTDMKLTAVNTFTGVRKSLANSCDIPIGLMVGPTRVETLLTDMVAHDIAADEEMATTCVISMCARALASQPRKIKKRALKEFAAYEREVLEETLKVLKAKPGEEEAKAKKELAAIEERNALMEAEREKERLAELAAAEEAEQDMGGEFEDDVDPEISDDADL